MRALVRRAVPYLACAALLVGVVLVRVLVESRLELRAGDAAIARGDVKEAVRRFRRAAHWYAPGNPWCEHAYDRLESIATQAESQGRSDDAYAAWRAIRASVLGTRWLVVSRRDRLDRANRHLAALMVEQPQPLEARDRDRARLREEYLSLLTEDHAPEPAWIVVLGVGFVVWLAAAFWGARNAWDDDDRVRARPMAIAAGGLALGMALFLLGVARA